MTHIKILVQGYSRPGKDCELASSTTTLIKTDNLNIIVDPGMNRELLLKALKSENLSPKDINYVILTHNHLDHCSLAGIFENALMIDDSSSYSFKGEIKDHDGKIPGTDIEIIKTPGHDQFHCSILVKTKELGRVVIAGDVFWWPESEKQDTTKESLLNHKDPYMKNKEQLIESRKKLLSLADYIIPGHGKMFKVIK